VLAMGCGSDGMGCWRRDGEERKPSLKYPTQTSSCLAICAGQDTRGAITLRRGSSIFALRVVVTTPSFPGALAALLFPSLIVDSQFVVQLQVAPVARFQSPGNDRGPKRARRGSVTSTPTHATPTAIPTPAQTTPAALPTPIQRGNNTHPDPTNAAAKNVDAPGPTAVVAALAARDLAVIAALVDGEIFVDGGVIHRDFLLSCTNVVLRWCKVLSLTLVREEDASGLQKSRSDVREEEHKERGPEAPVPDLISECCGLEDAFRHCDVKSARGCAVQLRRRSDRWEIMPVQGCMIPAFPLQYTSPL
jgi:hypothetical protein